MKLALTHVMPLFWVVLGFAAPVLADFITVEELTVDSAHAAPLYSTSILQSGVTYRLEASGFYLFNNFPGLQRRQADAEYVTEDFFQTVDKYSGGGVLDLLIVYGSTISDRLFNPAQGLFAQDVDWGPFNPNHIYSLDVVGNGERIGFVVSDDWRDNQRGVFDNAGSLTVKLQQDIQPDSVPVPEPSTLVIWSVSALIVAAYAWRNRQQIDAEACRR